MKDSTKPTKKLAKTKTASDLYKGTNRRLTIMVILMTIWTIFLIAGSVALIIFAIQAYNTVTDLKGQLKDKTSTFYQVIKEDVGGSLQQEVQNMVNSTNSMTDAIKNAQTQSIPSNYQNLLK